MVEEIEEITEEIEEIAEEVEEITRKMFLIVVADYLFYFALGVLCGAAFC
tara:strand:- start:827 stop:976 length:150 start_codon:yes stop_codon:yes gene_type:complete